MDDLQAAYIKLTPVERAIADWQMSWMVKRLPHQIPPKAADWTIWLLLAGRGAGKTRTAAEVLGISMDKVLRNIEVCVPLLYECVRQSIHAASKNCGSLPCPFVACSCKCV